MNKHRLGNVITIVLVLLAVSTALMIYMSNFKSVALDVTHYSDQYDSMDVYASFDSGTDLVGPTTELISYLEHDTDTIETDFFNEREKAHMVEVRGIFDVVFRVLDAAVVLSVICIILFMFMLRKQEQNLREDERKAHFRRRLSQMLTWVGYSVLIIAGVFVVMALTFDYTFIWFHQTFFVSDTWMLDPATDNMIKMLPFAFFLNTFVKIIIMSVCYAAIMFFAGLVVGKDWSKKYKH